MREREIKPPNSFPGNSVNKKWDMKRVQDEKEPGRGGEKKEKERERWREKEHVVRHIWREKEGRHEKLREKRKEGMRGIVGKRKHVVRYSDKWKS